MADSFPLQWPDGWQRTALSARRHSAYKVGAVQAYNEMISSLAMMGADRRTIVVSCNVRPARDGRPRFDERADDPGVAVYWNDKSFGERVIACDKYFKVAENVRAIGLALDGLRAMKRAGATQIMDRAFSAFGVLPAPQHVPEKRPWWEVLGLPKEMVGSLSMGMIDARYRELSKKLHPDVLGGSAEAMSELSQARDDAREHFGEAT